jgi:hypothetical protein
MHRVQKGDTTMSHPLSYQARRELIERMAPCYCESSCAQKGLLLDMLVTVTGYARKYAIGLLHQAPHGTQIIQRLRVPMYGPEVQHALVLVWKTARGICLIVKRLVACV